MLADVVLHTLAMGGESAQRRHGVRAITKAVKAAMAIGRGESCKEFEQAAEQCARRLLRRFAKEEADALPAMPTWLTPAVAAAEFRAPAAPPPPAALAPPEDPSARGAALHHRRSRALDVFMATNAVRKECHEKARALTKHRASTYTKCATLSKRAVRELFAKLAGGDRRYYLEQGACRRGGGESAPRSDTSARRAAPTAEN